MEEISVIIPTLNRAEFLATALGSLSRQTFDYNKFEVIVVDNGSQDNTKEIADSFIEKGILNIRYICETAYGLHNGRHRGANEAKTEILSFIDDDVIVSEDWLKSIKKVFCRKDASLVGGKILPRWEGAVPEWINDFKLDFKEGWTIGFLSLLDMGDEIKQIPADYVYGCNFSIRKPVLYECGGFHPDGMPQEMIRYRGDGESGLARKLMERGYTAIYDPNIVVYHRISTQRLTEEYLCQRAFNEGISYSYTQIRANGGLKDKKINRNIIQSLINKLKTVLDKVMGRSGKNMTPQFKHLQVKVSDAFNQGLSYHLSAVEKDPDLLKYVLKEKYY